MFDNFKQFVPNLLYLLPLILIPYLWIEATGLLIDDDPGYRWNIVGALTVVSILLEVAHRTSKIYQLKHIKLMFHVTLVLIFSIALWNYTFSTYSAGFDYVGDIFRDAFQNNRAPLYTCTHIAFKFPNRNWLVVLIPALYFIVFIWNYKRWDENWVVYSAIYLLAAIVAYAITDGMDLRLFLNNVHFKQFNQPAAHFSGMIDSVSNYVSKMDSLGRASHYPPGNVMLFVFERYHLPYFAKAFVMLCTVGSILPMFYTMKLLKMDLKSINLVVALYVFSTTIPSFPTIALTPITIFFGSVMSYYLLSYIIHPSWKSTILCATATFAFMFFSYSFTIIGLLMGLIVLFSWIFKLIPLKRIILFSVSFIVIVVLLNLIVYLITGFNQYDCFTKSVANNAKTMSDGFDNIYRYLFRSTGNIIAYLSAVGIPIVGYCSLAFYQSIKAGGKSLKDILLYSIVLTVVISGFSGLFFLETARIWILFTPYLCIGAGIALSKILIDGKKGVIIFAILLSVILSVVEEIYVDHAFGYFGSGW